MMRRRSFTLVALAVLLGILAGCGANAGQSATIARVGNTNITEAQFMTNLERVAQRINDFLAQSGSPDAENQVRQIIFDNILKEEVGLNEARTQGYGITTEEIEYFESTIDASITGGREVATFAQRDMWAKNNDQIPAESFTDYQAVVRRQMALDNYAQHVFDTDVAPLAVYRQIVIPLDSDPNASKIQADDLVRQIRTGANFADLAQQFSVDASAAKGGAVGPIDVRSLSPELSTIVQTLSLNTISDPIALTEGWTIIEVRGRRPYDPKSGKAAFAAWGDLIQTPEGDAYINQKIAEYKAEGELQYYIDPVTIPLPASIKQP